jgi:apolipoprotein N-acyltransferase
VRSPVAARRFLTLSAAALALGLAYAPFPCRFFAFIALVPLLRVVERSTPGRVFLWGWFFGGAAALFHFFWLWFLVVPVEPITRVLLDAGLFLLFAYLGLYTAVFATVVRRLGIWSAPPVWVLLEYARSRLQIAFPWDLLGCTMTPWTPFIQPAALGGVYLVSAWLVLLNVLLYRALRVCPTKPGPESSASPIALRPLTAFAVALLVPLAAGLVRMKPLPHWFNVAIVQPNVSPLDKGDWDSRERIQSDLVRLTQEAGAARPDLILFPETATLVDVTSSNTIGPALRQVVDSLDIEVFTGSPLLDRQRRTWHNGAVLIRPGEWPPAQRYYKMRLTPFSEKIPYSDEWPLIRRLIGTADMGDWTRGRDLTVFHWREGTLAGLICIEAIFADHARALVRRGADLLAVVTSDGWFGRVLGAQQHAELAVMRAVENGVPMVRSANNGISFIADPYGRVTRSTRLGVQTVLSGPVTRPLPATPYRRSGDWFVIACLLSTLALAVAKAAGSSAARSTALLHRRGNPES